MEQPAFTHDVFVCHASEDKAGFVDDLVKALEARGVRAWYDTFEIALGDDFRREMERGLLSSRFGLVVLSPSFLLASKRWPQNELSALLNLEASDGEKRILPVLHGVDWVAVTHALPFVATRRAADGARGIEAVADEVARVVKQAPARAGERRATRLYNVPRPSQSFVGRTEELAALRALLPRRVAPRPHPAALSLTPPSAPPRSL